MTDSRGKVDGRSHYDETNLTIDLLETLVGQDVVEPDKVPMRTVRSWFGAEDQEAAKEIVRDLDNDDEAPFVWESSERGEGHVYLTDYDETLAFTDYLQENPPWYERL